MKPCNCKDQCDANKLETQGIGINDWGMNVKPAVVEIEHVHYGNIKIPMSVMTGFAKWYLEDQSEE